MGYSIFAACNFQGDQTVTMHIGIPCEENEVSNYAIMNNGDIKPIQLKTEGGISEMKELYTEDHMVTSPKYPDMDNNRDRTK